MKKMFCLLGVFFVTSNAFANILINLKNVPNHKELFIFSLGDAKKIHATNVGSMAIISDEKLKAYSMPSDFTIGLSDEITTQYCVTSLEGSSQFFFTYSNKDRLRPIVQLEMKRNSHNELVPVCSI